MGRLNPTVVDVAEIQEAHPMQGDLDAWANEIARDSNLTTAVSNAVGLPVEPIVEPGAFRFTAHAQQGVEEHCDDNPYTALLYFSTLAPGDGGQIVFPDSEWRFIPTHGKAVVYPGHLRHYVTRQLRPTYRGMLAIAYQPAIDATEEP